MNKFQKRINYQGELEPLLTQTCKEFDIGAYNSHYIIPIGYEDFNLKLQTDKGYYFVKIFASFRNESDCKRYVDVIRSVLEAGVAHPFLYKTSQGFLYETSLNNSIDRLCVMEYVDGKTFYELQTAPTNDEIRFIIKQAALINKIDIKPAFVYDNWAIINFLEQYEKKNQYLNKADTDLIAPLIEEFNSLAIKSLPHCFIHGDITKTNVVKDNSNRLRIIDFAVSNYDPRIQELALLFCDLFFDPQKPESFIKTYEFAISEYQQYTTLTPDEIAKLPIYIKLAHAMHLLCANYEKIVLKNASAENNYFLNIGRVGLDYTSKLWK